MIVGWCDMMCAVLEILSLPEMTRKRARFFRDDILRCRCGGGKEYLDEPAYIGILRKIHSVVGFNMWIWTWNYEQITISRASHLDRMTESHAISQFPHIFCLVPNKKIHVHNAIHMPQKSACATNAKTFNPKQSFFLLYTLYTS